MDKFDVLEIWLGNGVVQGRFKVQSNSLDQVLNLSTTDIFVCIVLCYRRLPCVL